MSDWQCRMVNAPLTAPRAAVGRTAVSAQLQVQGSAGWPPRRRAVAGLLGTAGAFLAGCSQTSQYLSSTPPQSPLAATIGTGQVKAGLILPLSAAGNAGVAGQAMRNAAEMAVAEFN